MSRRPTAGEAQPITRGAYGSAVRGRSKSSYPVGSDVGLYGSSCLRVWPGAVADGLSPVWPGAVADGLSPVRPGGVADGLSPVRPGAVADGLSPVWPGAVADGSAPLSRPIWSASCGGVAAVPLEAGSVSTGVPMTGATVEVVATEFGSRAMVADGMSGSTGCRVMTGPRSTGGGASKGLSTAPVAKAAPNDAPVAMPMIAIVRRVIEFSGATCRREARIGDRAARNAARTVAASANSWFSPARRVAVRISRNEASDGESSRPGATPASNRSASSGLMASGWSARCSSVMTPPSPLSR